MINRYIIAPYFSTKVIFVFILPKENFTERTSEDLKLSRMLVKVKYLESFQI